MLICKHCQAELPEYIRFCGRCGNFIEKEDSPPLEKQAVADFPTAFLPPDAQQDQLQENGQGAYIPPYAYPPYPYDRPGYISAGEETVADKQVFGAVNSPPSQSIGSPIQGEDAGFGQHGLHHQPSIQHGEHHQAQAVHGAHHQAQAAHGAHHQAQAVHGAHHQAQAAHGAHHQARAAHHAQQGLKGCRPSCLTMVVSSAVVVTVVAASLAVLFLYILPGRAQPALNMPTSVSPGEIVTAQGSNFSPGQHILITIDTRQKADVDKPATLLSANLLGSVQDLTRQTAQRGTLLTVKNDGTFTTTLQADQSWHEGSQHTLYISRQDGSLIVSKQFTVKAGKPALVLCGASTSSATTTLGPVAAGQDASISTAFKLCTQGSGEVDWSSSWDTQQAPWLQLVQSGHVQAPQAQPLQLTASAKSLKAGNYATTVTFSSQHSTIKITLKVTLIVLDPNAQTCIQPNTTSLTLTGTPGQGSPVQQSVTVSNCGESGDWSAVTTTDDGANWLSVNPGNGTLQKGASQDITVTAMVTDLVAGTYTGHIVFGIGSNAAHIDVVLVVTNTPQAQPCLTVNSGQLNFTANAQGSDPAAQGVTITNNCGTGSWSATTDQSWLGLSALSGNINANSNINLNVQASIASLAAGTYTGHVTFYPGTATVTVVLNVQPVPCISVQGSPLNFSAMEGSTSANAIGRVLISNGASCVSGAWTAQSDVPWITVNPSSGSLNAGATAVIPISIDENAVGTGSFSGHITFSPGSGSSVLTVNLTVYHQLCISASTTPNMSTTSLTFSDYIGRSPSPASQTFTVTNCGYAGTLSISGVTTDSGGNWLNATGGGPVSAGGSQTFTVTVNASSTYGTYTGHIYISITGNDGGTIPPIQVDVTYYVSYYIA